MQQLTLEHLNGSTIEEPSKSGVHIEVHDDLYYGYRGMLRITRGSRHRSVIERELASHMLTKHRIVIYSDGFVEAQWSHPKRSGGQWIGCMSDTHYPYEAAWKSSNALSHAKQYFARYCISEYEVETLQTVFPYKIEAFK